MRADRVKWYFVLLPAHKNKGRVPFPQAAAHVLEMGKKNRAFMVDTVFEEPKHRSTRKAAYVALVEEENADAAIGNLDGVGDLDLVEQEND